MSDMESAEDGAATEVLTTPNEAEEAGTKALAAIVAQATVKSERVKRAMIDLVGNQGDTVRK
jgi:hypothetical protein